MTSALQAEHSQTDSRRVYHPMTGLEGQRGEAGASGGQVTSALQAEHSLAQSVAIRSPTRTCNARSAGCRSRVEPQTCWDVEDVEDDVAGVVNRTLELGPNRWSNEARERGPPRGKERPEVRGRGRTGAGPPGRCFLPRVGAFCRPGPEWPGIPCPPPQKAVFQR